MASYNAGKTEAVEHLMQFTGTCLDVGACDGKWSDLLGKHFVIDAVEAWKPNIDQLKSKYNKVYNLKIQEFCYKWYDVIIMGDVIEHMSEQEAQRVIEYAYPKCRELLVAVPYMYKQGAIKGNPFEEHIQDELTHEKFMELYKGFKVLTKDEKYGYYVKGEER